MTDVRVVLEVPRALAAQLSAGAPFALTGLETPAPTLTLGATVLRGTFRDAVGTDLVVSAEGRLAAAATKRLVFREPPPPAAKRPPKKKPAAA